MVPLLPVVFDSMTAEPDGEPMKHGTSVSDLACGLWSANAVQAALLMRHRTGKGQWIKRKPAFSDFDAHLLGNGAGLGLPPLRLDGTVKFAAIDLDEPDFEAAREMQKYIPGPSFLERSRSGNAHVWVFFEPPIEAWVVRGILREAILAAGKGAVEVFPKQDRLLEGMVGNYINLPYFGDTRPIVYEAHIPREGVPVEREYTAAEFVRCARLDLNDPADWRKRAVWLQIVPPEQRERSDSVFGEQAELHMCAEWIVGNCEENPVVEGSRNAVFFALAKQMSNYVGFDHDEVWAMMQRVNRASPDPAPEAELKRILANAERGQYTSTDCDNPLVQPYCHPDCPIAFPKGH